MRRLLRFYQLLDVRAIENVSLAQDWAPAYRKREFDGVIRAIVRGNIIALGHDIEWAWRSPDVTPLNFLGQGYLKSKVFTTPLRTLIELHERNICAVKF